MQAILKAHIYAFLAGFCHLSLLGCLLSQEKQKYCRKWQRFLIFSVFVKEIFTLYFPCVGKLAARYTKYFGSSILPSPKKPSNPVFWRYLK